MDSGLVLDGPCNLLESSETKSLDPCVGQQVIETEKRNKMDDHLRTKLNEARGRMNDQQAGINADRKHDDLAIRQWARGKQRPANAERNQFRASLTDEDLEQIEVRIEQLIHENPALSAATIRTVDSKTARPSVPVEVLEEYHFLRDMVS